jgi:hypothetical protein
MSRSPSRVARYRFTPRLEALEDRSCPAVLVTLTGQTLTIVGDNHANVVTVHEDDGATDLEVRADGVKHNFAANAVTTIAVDLKAGNDQFTYNFGEDVFKFPKTILVKLGKGNDQVHFDLNDDTNAPGQFTTVKANLDIHVTGGKGSDVVTADFGTVDSANVSLDVDLGQARRTQFFGRILGDLKGTAQETLDVQGGRRNDLLSVLADNNLANGHPGIDIDAGAALEVHLHGGPGNDHLVANYQGKVAGSLAITEDGGPGNDDLTLAAHALNVPFPPGTVLSINGGPGHNTCRATPNVTEHHCQVHVMLP